MIEAAKTAAFFYSHHHMKSNIETDPIILFNELPISPEVFVTIVIPAKNEEEYIVECLTAFLHQIDQEGQILDQKSFEILVLANNCTDHTVRNVHSFKEENPTLQLFVEEIFLEKEKANIGFVRKSLMDAAHSRLKKNGGGIIMTTDADTLVSEDWIFQNISEINNGADAVGGRILFKEEEFSALDQLTSTLHQKDEKYQLLVAELESLILQNFDCNKMGHHQHFNGSFAVTTDCYERSGGIPDVVHLEDCAFYEQLLRVDANVRHSNEVSVQTSARYIGRTEIGLSNQLNIWSKINPANTNFLVESADSLVNRFRIKKKLLHLWKRRDLESLDFVQKLKLIDDNTIFDEQIISKFYASNYFGEWFQEIKDQNESTWLSQFTPGFIDQEILKLGDLIKNYSA